jgi:hypothetical protein
MYRCLHRGNISPERSSADVLTPAVKNWRGSVHSNRLRKKRGAEDQTRFTRPTIPWHKKRQSALICASNVLVVCFGFRL